MTTTTKKNQHNVKLHGIMANGHVAKTPDASKVTVFVSHDRKYSVGVEIKCPNCMQIISSGSEDDVSCPECKAVILQQRINSVYQGGLNNGIYS